MEKQFNVVIEEDITNEIRKIAIDRKLTVAELVEEIFKREINSYEKRSVRK